MRHIRSVPHIRSVLIASAIALLSATTAQASVIYDWHSTSLGHYVTATGGELVVTDAAYRLGSIDFYVDDSFNPGLVYDKNFSRITNSPVVSVDLSFNGGDIPGLSVHPGGYLFTSAHIPIFIGLTFNGDGTLSGSMSLVSDTGSDDIEVDGSDGDWAAFNYESDYFSGGECGANRCSVGSGFWQFSRVEVPAPPVWPLFGLAILGLLSLLRLRCRA